MDLFKIGFLTVTLIDVIDLILVSWLFYKIYQYFRETRAGQMLVGLIILLIASFLFNAIGFSADIKRAPVNGKAGQPHISET